MGYQMYNFVWIGISPKNNQANMLKMSHKKVVVLFIIQGSISLTQHNIHVIQEELIKYVMCMLKNTLWSFLF